MLDQLWGHRQGDDRVALGQRGVGAAGPCVLHRGDALAFSDVAWGTSEAVGSSFPAASASPMLLPQAGPVCPWGCAGNSRGGGTRRERGKLSWKQVTCARLVVGMGVAMETASPNSILHPTPGAWLP